MQWIMYLLVQHLLINCRGGHAATKESKSCEIIIVTRIHGASDVLFIKHLMGGPRSSQCAVVLESMGRRGYKTTQEEKEDMGT